MGAYHKRSCPVKVAVCILNQWALRIRAVGSRETVQHGERPCWSNLEHGAKAVRAARICCPVEVTISTLNQFRVRVTALGTAEAV